MAYYLVSAEVKENKLDELKERLDKGELKKLSPYGKAMTYSLNNARYDPDSDRALWEEEDYCSPPLAQEKSEVLNDYFVDIREEQVPKGEGWKQIEDLPELWQQVP
ncbi:MAG: hypothetical protein GF372_11280 [Candidatus Marinimicrobia bacterium]|nr:hypothetical protein [Candidatus Neomarinimicrobiota bacterium]